MDDGLKQRIVGAIVLIAVAVIFVPTLFDSSRRAVDTTSQVPPEPVVVAEPLEVPEPQRPDLPAGQTDFNENYSHPPVETSPEATTENSASTEQSTDTDTDKVAAAEPETVEDSTPVITEPQTLSDFNQAGIPQAWSVQVASFSERDRAERMLAQVREQGFPRSYIGEGQTAQGRVFRVFIGPKISKADAQAIQRQVTEKMEIDSLLVSFEP